MSARRLLVAATLVALALPSAAAAHVTVTPHRLAPGAETLLAFSVPNEREHVNLRALTVTLPAHFVVGDVETKPGWSATVAGRTVVWSGGRIRPREFAEFRLHAVAATTNGSSAATAIERFAGGATEAFHPRLVVASAPAAARLGHDSGARTLGRFALAIALAAALLAVAAGFLALRTWLVSPQGDDSGPSAPAAGDQTVPGGSAPEQPTTLLRASVHSDRIVTRGPYWFLGGRPFREAELRSYIIRQHRRGRPLREILGDAYLRRYGAALPWRALTRPDTVAALHADVRDAIEHYRPPSSA
jgi:hypothetical protein